MYTRGPVHSCSEAASLLVHPQLLPEGWRYLYLTEVERSGLVGEHCHVQRVSFNGFVQKYVTPRLVLPFWRGV